ncbi:SUKH-4 immunity protein [Streptomyces sp. 1222.5]|uniref:SUKH-4 family immunity protein n=1 Tax=unclassified Streptomyces TaxID=2593676 RepID=UPI000894A476|nr:MULTISPECIES: SUKH-4 family immunity protein [unclassified Streptomyces]PKW00257.1 SUKH-4 immunity protein of toxin-antitoxin system [Streptomyces sp. 5112.2]SED84281.1 SUKH-4 immunity protein [Streptomyces sp. 1222.5]
MNQRLPQLPKPEFVLLTLEPPHEVPTQIAVALSETGVPGGSIGYEYRPLSEPALFGAFGERGPVAIATSGLCARIAVDVASGRLVQLSDVASSTTHHVNRDLDSFISCVAAVVARFPFYAEGDEGCEEVAEELRRLISEIDETAQAGDGFWQTFCDDVAIGDYADADA